MIVITSREVNIARYAIQLDQSEHEKFDKRPCMKQSPFLPDSRSLSYSFGAKLRSYTTGMVYNNHMATFSLPNVSKSYQPKSSNANYIAPGKRSISTSCPTIVVDKTGSVRMIVGASGGLRITTGVPTVIIFI